MNRTADPLLRVSKIPGAALFALPQLAMLYSAAEGEQPLQVAAGMLDGLRFEIECRDEDLAQIPTEGPVVVVANHPFGCVEGLAMAVLLGRVRPDLKLLANYVLGVFPRLRPMFIFVNPFDSPQARRENVRGVKDSLSWLRAGSLLAVFPAGAVAHYDLRERHITDPPWTPNVAGLVRRTGATVVPLFFAGNNGPMFQMAGLVHPRLRTALLARELMNKHRHVGVARLGRAIRPDEYSHLDTDEQIIEYFRLRTYALSGRGETRRQGRRLGRKAPREQPLATPVPRTDLKQDIAALPAETQFCDTRDLRGFVVEASQIPRLLPEIGRLRELTFRGVGEGTGQPLDLDCYDRWYSHLLLWNHAAGDLVGAYRLGLSDRILPVQGKRGFYVSSLFDLSDELFERMGPCVELGRSFVRPEYQKQIAPMVVLWQGVAQFLAREVRYRRLFGPVSISANYRPASRALIMSFLMRPPYRSEFASLVKPRTPFDPRRWMDYDVRRRLELVRDVDDLNRIVTDIEPDGKGIPPLLRQYLKLGAKVLAFNLDPAFGNCLDGLCVFDAAQVDGRRVRHYATTETVERFKGAHDVDDD